MITPKIAFLFPGQGSQTVGMGAELSKTYKVALEIFTQADQILNVPISQIAWNGPPELLNDTKNTQPALLTHSIAAYYVLKDLLKELTPNFVAGHSMGEISALVASGALSFPQALILAAVIGLDIRKIEQICSQVTDGTSVVQVANDNCPDQVVISGSTSAITRAIEIAKNSGARRVIPLNVSIAAHSPLMNIAQGEFNRIVDNLQLIDPSIPLIGNVTAKLLNSADELREDLIKQLTSRVRWTESILLLIAMGVNTFIEIGNGFVLCGLIKRIDNTKTCFSISSSIDIKRISSEF
jgi:[acyl-carrier-protein] S-malonyltransferase